MRVFSILFAVTLAVAFLATLGSAAGVPTTGADRGAADGEVGIDCGIADPLRAWREEVRPY